MSSRLLPKLFSILMVVVMATAPVLADSSAAMLRTKGKVTVNGNAAAESAAIFAGDQVRTSEGGQLAITADGSAIVVPGNSSLVYQGKNVEVLCGAALVSTSRGVSARVSNLTVSPASASARYEVQQTKERLVINANQGDLVISDGARQMFLEEGHSLYGKGGCESAAVYEARAVNAEPVTSPTAVPASNAQIGGSGASTALLVAAFVIPIVVGIALVAGATGEPDETTGTP